MISLICVWINDWVNNGETGDLRRYRAHYDVIVMDRLNRIWIRSMRNFRQIWITIDTPLVKLVTGLQLLAVYTFNKPECGSNIHLSERRVLQLYARLEDSLGRLLYLLLCTSLPNPEFGLQIHLRSLQHTQYGIIVFPVTIDMWIDLDEISNGMLYTPGDLFTHPGKIAKPTLWYSRGKCPFRLI